MARPGPNTVLMLLTAGETGAVAPLNAQIGAGVRGEAVRHVALANASAEALESARAGAHRAYSLLYREKYIDCELVVRFDAGVDLNNVHGRSADLAFALALAAGWCDADGAPVFQFPPAAATGALSDDGGILPVDGVALKLPAAIKALPRGGMVLYPRANDAEVTAAIRKSAAAKGVVLAPCDRLEEALQRLGARLSHTWLDSPFRGLEPFEFAHASIFFGREVEIEAVLALIQRREMQGRRAILIEGPSGGGKSSLVLAGVVPALLRRGLPGRPGEGFRWGLLRPWSVKPDLDPAVEAESLASALQQAWLHDQHGALDPHPQLSSANQAFDADRFADWLKAGAATHGEFVLVLDQMEQWFDGPLQPATVARLCALLAALTTRGMTLIATMARSGLDRLSEHPELAASIGVEGRFALDQPLDASRLEAVIREPARAARLTFEPGLEAEIFAAASHGGADVLPLLELLLTELFERRDRARNLLRTADYAAVGGLDGVISARAESVYAQCSPDEQAAVAQLIWKLDTAGEVLLSDFPAGSPMTGLAAAFRDKRLLVQDQDAGGQVSLRVAHDALLRHWSRAVALRQGHEADARRWLDLIREAGQWARGERALIPAGPQLTAARDLYQRRLSQWTASDGASVAYVLASTGQLSRRRLITAIAVGVPTAAGVIVGGGALVRYLEDRRFRRITFDDVAVTGPDFFVAAAPYLKKLGVSIDTVSPDRCRMVIRSNIGLYGGRAADGQHFLTEEADPWAAPMSYTLGFERAPKAIRLVRASLWAATGSGVTHPSWTAQAFDGAGREIAKVQEDLVRSFTSVPAATFLLQGSKAGPIASLKITSDFRLDGKPFAGFQAALIKELQLAF